MIPPVIPISVTPVTMLLDPEEPDLDQAFLDICRANPDLRIERTAEGDIIIMAPAAPESGARNASLSSQLYRWSRVDGRGVAFDSSAGFTLPNGAIRSPDASWVRRERLAALTASEKKGFLPLCPDFVVELRSTSDRPGTLQAKMAEYLANGAKLGWLIDPTNRTVYVYRPQTEVVRLDVPDSLAGDPELPGFVLALAEVWDPGF